MKLKNVCKNCTSKIEIALNELINVKADDNLNVGTSVDFIDESNGKIYTINMIKKLSWKSKENFNHESESV